MHPYVYYSTIYSRKEMETIDVPIIRLIDNEDVAHILNGILFAIKGKQMLQFTTTWMKLQGTMLSET